MRGVVASRHFSLLFYLSGVIAALAYFKMFHRMYSQMTFAKRVADLQTAIWEVKAAIQSDISRLCVSCRNNIHSFRQFYTIHHSWLVPAFVALGSTVLFLELSRLVDDVQEDPFQILGVASNATLKEIKKAYRSLSMKYHRAD
mmetsp:Transcript_72104/g.208849  ORF Transcript_72104/g.208849 Transcript_72104/m.208849 type:complete len:143 (-) Transcript_72104:165-593(-)